MSLHRIDQPASDPTTRPTSDTSIPGTASAQPRDRRASHPGPTWAIRPLVERVLPSTVAVLTTHASRARRRIGHGLTEDGLILTNSHVVAERGRIDDTIYRAAQPTGGPPPSDVRSCTLR